MKETRIAQSWCTGGCRGRQSREQNPNRRCVGPQSHTRATTAAPEDQIYPGSSTGRSSPYVEIVCVNSPATPAGGLTNRQSGCCQPYPINSLGTTNPYLPTDSLGATNPNLPTVWVLPTLTHADSLGATNPNLSTDSLGTTNPNSRR